MRKIDHYFGSMTDGVDDKFIKSIK